MRLSDYSFLSLAFLFAYTFLFFLLLKKESNSFMTGEGGLVLPRSQEVVHFKETIFQFNDTLAKSSDQKPIPLGSQIAPHLAMDNLFESTGSFANCSDPVPATLGGDRIVVSCHSVNFKVSRKAFQKDGQWNVIVGILSSSSNVKRRKVIRSTWAKGRSGIFFVVAGEWRDVSKEFQTFGDLIWIDVEEDYHKITYKSAAFFAVVDRVTRDLNVEYEYAMKTDDDSYVALDRVETFLRHLNKVESVKPDYIGKCNKKVSPIRNSSHKYYTSLEEYPESNFPTYCQGCGFIVSHSFIQCLSHHHNIGTVRYVKHEDVFIGLLAERCGVNRPYYINEHQIRLFRTGCNHNSRATKIEKERILLNGNPVRDVELPIAEMAARMIQHRVNSDADMVRHYKSHLDPCLILSPDEINVGDFIEYYVTDENGWHGADVLNVSKSESERKNETNNSLEWARVGLYFRLDQKFSFLNYIPFMGSWRKPCCHPKTSNSADYVFNNGTIYHGVSTDRSKNTTKKGNNENLGEYLSPIRPSIILEGLNITENKRLFSEHLYRVLEKYFANHSPHSGNECKPDGAEAKYSRVLKETMAQQKDKGRFLSKELWGGFYPCPLILLFYYEETSDQDMDNFAQFYNNFDPQCIKFALPWDFVDSLEVEAHQKQTGFQFILSRARYSDQNRVINDALSNIRKSCGPHCLVSVNDMDHYLVWRYRGEGLEFQPSFYKYNSYSDAVRLYMYSFLTTPGCGNKNIHETMVAPCTCFLKNNAIYEKTERPLFSEYGVNNLFHPTTNFFVPPNFVGTETVGTVFSNLDPPLKAVAHHTMGDHMVSFNLTNPITPAIIHLRKAGGMIRSIERYTKFLDGSRRNQWSSFDGTVGEAMACAQRNPKWLIRKKRLCGKVKEVSNIFATVIQRKKCLDAGMDQVICSSELPCCVTVTAS